MVINSQTTAVLTKVASGWQCQAVLPAVSLSSLISEVQQAPPTCLINVNTNTAGDSGPGCNKHRRHESPLCLSNQSQRRATSCMFTPHMETTCKLAFGQFKMQRINPCSVVRNYFDLECKMEFVAYSAQTLTLFFVNSFMCMYLYACSVSLGIIVTLLWPVALHYSLHPTLSHLLLHLSYFSFPFPSSCFFPLSSHVLPVLFSILFQSAHRSRWIGDNLRCALFSP